MRVFLQMKIDISSNTLLAEIEQKYLVSPDKVAVICDDKKLTYSELWRSAYSLSEKLSAFSSNDANEVFAIVACRNIETIISMVAVLMAGGAYFPIDPTLPAERIKFLFSKAKVGCFIIQSESMGVLKDIETPCVLYKFDGKSYPAPDNFINKSSANSIAYVLSTSGSTGEPKIVAIKHESVIALLNGYNQISPISAPVCSLAVCPFPFDVSVLEVFSALTEGGTVVLLTEEQTKDPMEIAARIIEHKVTSAYIPPLMLSPLLSVISEAKSQILLERILVGVEPISEGDLQKWKNIFEKLSIVNGYGPTEATICSTFFKFERMQSPEQRTPIGKAIPGWFVEILDENFRPVSKGQIGEIFIAGVGLMRGYMGSDSRDGNEFVRLHNVQNLPKDLENKWYRTGDFGRLDEEGNIIYCGRKDEQVKIRGFRVDLGEIEAAAKECSGVQACIALAPHDDQGRRLYLFIEAEKEFVSTIYEHLISVLPGFMIPSRIVFMKKFPLTSNGKIDRKNLLGQVRKRPLSTEIKLPETEYENLFLPIWRDVLGLDEIGTDDNFIELGGDSRLALSLSIKMANAIGSPNASAKFLKCRTVSQCAQQAEIYKKDMTSVAGKPIERAKCAPLTDGQKGLWAYQHIYEGSTAFILPVAIMFKGAGANASAISEAVKNVIDSHDIFNLGIDTVDNSFVWTDIKKSAFVQDSGLLNEKYLNEEISNIVTQDSKDILNQQDVITRVRCMETNAGNVVVLFTMHHVAIDGQSMSLIVRDIISNLECAVDTNVKGGIKEFSIDYADTKNTEEYGKQKAYWENLYSAVPEPLSFWTPFERSSDKREPGLKVHRRKLSSHEVILLSGLARECAASKFEVMMSLVSIMAHRMTGQAEFSICSPVSLRGLSSKYIDTVGYLVNLLPFKFDVAAKEEVLKYIQRTIVELRKAKDNFLYPFEQMLKDICTKAELKSPDLTRFVVAEDVCLSLPARSLGMDIEEVFVARERPIYELALFVSFEGDNPGLRWEYDSSLFDCATIEILDEALKTILQNVSIDKDCSIECLNLMSRPKQEKILLDAENQLLKLMPQASLIEVFDEMVLNHPNDLAITSELGDFCTYQDLYKRSLVIASQLIKVGISEGAPVLLLATRSVEFIVAIIGILRAGGCYIPIDDRVPAERVCQIVSTANAHVGLVSGRIDNSWCSAVRESLSSNFILLDTADIEGKADEEGRVEGLSCRSINTPAYIMFTSGSMGAPKGVVVPDRGILRLAKYTNFSSFTKNDVFVLLSNISFDAATLEIWGALLNGGKIAIPEEKTVKVPDKLLEFLEKSEITAGFFNVTLFRWIVESNPAAIASMHTILVGGEQVPPELFSKAEKFFPFHTLLNGYGPTENTTFTCCYRLEQPTNINRPVPVGYPLAYSAALVVDGNMSPVPVGAIGEILAGGAGVALGYIGDNEETLKRFFHDDKERCWYRTGDYGRVMPSGAIVCLGRIDDQIKIRGFRIEISEIETAFRKQDGVNDVMILAVDADGGKRLEAYIEGRVNVAGLRENIGRLLPSYMVPSRIFTLDKMPINQNGKKDKAALIAFGKSGVESHSDMGSNVSISRPSYKMEEYSDAEIYNIIHDIFSDALKIDRIGPEEKFFDIGVSSLLLVILAKRIGDQLGKKISAIELLDNPTLSSLSRRVYDLTNAKIKDKKNVMEQSAGQKNLIAVVGMAGRFSGCDSIDEFWERALAGKVDVVRLDSVSEDEIPYRGILRNSNRFDHSFFGIPYHEAQMIDPQQRVLLEVSQNAIENAAIKLSSADDAVSVYAACGPSSFEDTSTSLAEQYEHMLAKSSEFVALRLSYRLNLRGESITVQTGCSSSLVAIHLACQSLLSGQSNVALAAGVSFQEDQSRGYNWEPGMITSPTGVCKPFDVDANGTVPGGGAAAVVLMRLQDALLTGHKIHAVVRSTALNNDGSSKVGFMAPSPSGQSEVIKKAQKLAGVEPHEISYVETHGTGTDLGDAIEAEGLVRVFSQDPLSNCMLGSTKANSGHMDRAAGIAGFIRAVMAVKSGLIPPMAGFTELNPRLNLSEGGLKIPRVKQEWPKDRSRRIAGVSSFGVGGTNAHSIIEAADLYIENYENDGLGQIIPISASSPDLLLKQIELLKGELQADRNTLGDISHTLINGRNDRRYRRAIYAKNKKEALAKIEDISSSIDSTSSKGKIIWVFPGQGDAGVNPYKELYHNNASYKSGFDQCAKIIKTISDIDVYSLLFGSNSDQSELCKNMHEFQPAMFAVQWAHVCFWKSLGLSPDIVLGHSLGEVMAATLAGILSLDDAVKLVVWRSRLMQMSRPAAMISATVPASTIREILPEDVFISAENGRSLTILAGEISEIGLFQLDLEKGGATTRRLAIPRAAHSGFMNEASVKLTEMMSGIKFQKASIPIISNITGTWDKGEMCSAEYWGKHLISPVLFTDSLQLLMNECANGHVLVLGPAKSMAHMISYEMEGAMSRVNYLENEEGDSERDIRGRSLAFLWEIGWKSDISMFVEAKNRHFLHLPGTVFDHSKEWDVIKRNVNQSITLTSPVQHVRLEDSGSWIWERKEKEFICPAATDRGGYLCPSIDLSKNLPDERDIDIICTNSRNWIVCKVTDGEAESFRNAGRISAYATKHNKNILLCSIESNKEPLGKLTAVMAAKAIQKAAQLEFPEINWSFARGLFNEEGISNFDLETLASLKSLSEEIEVRMGKIYSIEYVHSWPDWVSRPLRDNGVYVITGGTGRVARAMALAIAQKVKANIVLLGRRGEESVQAEIQDIRSILGNYAANIIYESLDIRSKEQVKLLFDGLRDKFGRIDGIIHAAGATDTREFPLIDVMTDDNLRQVTEAKIEGCHSIDFALKGDDADFIILCSSLSTALGGIGFSSYIAGNLYLDQFAMQKSQEGDRRWISVAWDAWTERSGFLEDKDSQGPARYSLSDEDGVQVFWRTLAAKNPNVLVSTGDVLLRRHEARQLAAGVDSQKEKNENSNNQHAVGLVSSYEIVCDTIKSVLGKLPDDPNRDLKEDGLESLTILQIVTRLKKRAKVPISLAEAMRNLSLNGLEHLISASFKAGEGPPPLFELKKAEVAEIYPVSSLQKRWLVLMPEGYGGLDIVVEAKGRPDSVSVVDAVRKVIHAHSALRTRFPKYDQDWYQLVENGAAVEELDLRSESQEKQTDILRQLVEEKTDSWFDVENIVPFEITVAILSDDCSAIVIHAHHVLFDGTSSSIFLRDVSKAFSGEDVVPEYQYIDYTIGQQAHLNSKDILPYRDFWMKEFEGAPVPTRVPSDLAAASEEGDDRGDCVSFSIDENVMRRIRKIARDRNATSFTLMMAAFGLLLREKTDSSDLVVGTTTAGRPNEATEGIIGVFVNPLPLRIKFPEKVDFELYIDYVQKILLNLHEYQHYPMEDLTLNVPPFLGMGLNDTFHCYILYQNYWRPDEAALVFRRMDVGAHVHHKLMREYEFVLEDNGDSIAGEFWYRPSRFSYKMAQQDSQRFVDIITALSFGKLP